MPTPDADVLIVGAGVAGLAAAVHLEAAGLTCLNLEASDDIGGRVRTDLLHRPEGTYRLDRGFQILLTAYPEAQALLDLPALDLRPFVPGALTFTGDHLRRISDPRRGGNLLQTLLSSVFTPADAFRSARLLFPLLRGNPLDLLPPKADPSDPRWSTTRDFLIARGFSDRMMRAFWNPFLSGVFLDKSLSPAAGFFQFTLRMFATGDAVIPRLGIGEIPRQLARKLVRSTVRLQSRAVGIEPGQVLLSTGECLTSRAVLVATDGRTARRLLPRATWPSSTLTRQTTTLYFSAPTAPVEEPILLLDGEGTGPINHGAVLSRLGDGFAPPGRHLISLSAVGPTPDDLVPATLSQMQRWFGTDVRQWELLQTCVVHNALPDASPASRTAWTLPAEVAPGLYRAGDSLSSPSTQGAMSSARRAASVIVRGLS